ncbi:MAG: hypothetical protein R3F55_17135 [Alphaproteobacteria bacterium]
MRRVPLPTLSALYVAGAASAASAQQPDFAFSVDPWAGSAFYAAESQSFSHCMMAAQFDRQMSLVVALDGGGGVSLGVRNPRWALSLAEQQPMGFRLGGNSSYDETATAVDSTLLLVRFADGDAILAELAQAPAISVTQGSQNFQFVIVNGPAAIAALKDCTVAARIGVSVEPVAVADEEPAAGAIADPDADPRDRTILVDPITLDQTVARSFLGAAGLDDFALLTPEELDDFLGDARAAWTDGAVYGALYTIAPRERRLDRAIERILAVFTEGCGGEYTTSPLVEPGAGDDIQRRAASCDEDQLGMLFRVSALNGESGTLVIIHAALREEAAELADVDDRLIAAIRRGQIAVQ